MGRGRQNNNRGNNNRGNYNNNYNSGYNTNFNNNGHNNDNNNSGFGNYPNGQEFQTPRNNNPRKRPRQSSTSSPRLSQNGDAQNSNSTTSRSNVKERADVLLGNWDEYLPEAADKKYFKNTVLRQPKKGFSANGEGNKFTKKGKELDPYVVRNTLLIPWVDDIQLNKILDSDEYEDMEDSEKTKKPTRRWYLH